MPTSTSNFGLLQPLVSNATDQDLWGNFLNSNIGNDDTLLLLAMTNKTVAETANFSVSGRTNGTATTGSLRNLFLCNCTGAAITASLPAANSVDNGFVVAFKKTDASANSLTVSPNGADTVEGVASLVVTAQDDSFVLVSDGSSNWNIISYKHGTAPKSFSVNIQTFLAAGSFNYTPTAGLVDAEFEMAGGGGGGGGVAATFDAGAGGGSGGYLKALLTAAQITAALSGGVIAGNVGAAGTAGASGGGNGGTGGTTSLGALLSCTGGVGGGHSGQNNDVFGGTGGTATVSTGQTLAAFTGQSGSLGAQNSTAYAGGGGSNPLGFGGAPIMSVGANMISTGGLNATGYGAGGGGAINAQGVAASAGGLATGGIVIIKEYIYA